MNRKEFWRGFWQGLTWPISWPLMWAFYGTGLLAAGVIQPGKQRSTPWRWWHYVAFRVYQYCMPKSAFWNHVGGFHLWSKAT